MLGTSLRLSLALSTWHCSSQPFFNEWTVLLFNGPSVSSLLPELAVWVTKVALVSMPEEVSQVSFEALLISKQGLQLGYPTISLGSDPASQGLPWAPFTGSQIWDNVFI